MYYYNARWHDPYLNRFLSPDSIIPESVQGIQAWDRYAYVNNNPVRYNDPSGHCIGPLVLVCAGVGLVISAVVIALGNEQVAWASSQPETIAKEQAAAQQWQDNCMGQCHYADHVSPTPGVVAGGARPETPVSDTLVEGYYNIAQGTVGVVGSATGLISAGLTASRQATASSTAATQHIDDLANEVSDWVTQGGTARVIRNADGDFILVDSANTRKFRFDLNNPHPHQNPHMHFEWRDDTGEWVGPRFYPSDVDPK